MKTIYFLLISVSLVMSLSAQKISKRASDYLLPKKSETQLGVYTGIPYIGITELSYGISHRFSVGALFGITPVVYGYGIRIKAILLENSNSNRIVFKSPLLYYPKTKGLGGDPWVLAWPTLNFDWKISDKERIWTGVGVVGAACAESIFGKEKEMKKGISTTGIMHDLWNTFQIGYSKAIDYRTNFIIEVAPVFKGFKPANQNNWVGGPPVIFSFGISRKL